MPDQNNFHKDYLSDLIRDRNAIMEKINDDQS